MPGSPCCLYLPRYLVQIFVPPTFPNVGGTSKQIIMNRPIERTETHCVVVVLINICHARLTSDVVGSVCSSRASCCRIYRLELRERHFHDSRLSYSYSYIENSESHPSLITGYLCYLCTNAVSMGRGSACDCVSFESFLFLLLRNY